MKEKPYGRMGGFSYRGKINTNQFLLIETLEKFEKNANYH
jgi:hypothetical protein